MDSLAIELREFLQMGREAELGRIVAELSVYAEPATVCGLLWARRRGEELEAAFPNGPTRAAERVNERIDELMGQAGDEAWARLVDRCVRKPRGRRPGRPTHMTEAEIRAARTYGGRGSARRWVRLDDGRLVESPTAPAPQSLASST